MLDSKDWLWIKDLQSHGCNLSQISRKTGFDRKTVRKYVNSTSVPEPKKRERKETKLDRYKKHLINRLHEGDLSASYLFGEIKEMGFTGKYTIVRDYIREIRLSQGIIDDRIRRQ